MDRQDESRDALRPSGGGLPSARTLRAVSAESAVVPAEAPAASRWSRGVRAFLRAAAVAAVVAVAASLVLRFTVRDGVPGLSVLYYATPLALDAAGALVAALVAWRYGMRRLRVAAATLALASGALCVADDFVWNAPSPPGALRGVFWNVAYGLSGWPKIVETLRSFDADVVWITEIAGDDFEAERLLAEAFPGWKTARSKGGILVLSRGDVTLVQARRLSRSNVEAVFRVTLDGRSFDGVQVDLASNPRNRRVEALERVADDVPHLAATPVLVLGDFNTPRGSVGFDRWRGPLANAFETAGRGLDATWPVPVPLLSCDQVWFGGGLVVRTCETPWTWRSDHLPVVFTFDLP
jgi:endonuclease/exonuclease/phosphatase family metal-dependent hydrolase